MELNWEICSFEFQSKLFLHLVEDSKPLRLSHTAPPDAIMARSSRLGGASKPFAWTTVLYLLLVFIAPLAFLGTAHASEEQNVQENYGTGMLPAKAVLDLRGVFFFFFWRSG